MAQNDDETVDIIKPKNTIHNTTLWQPGQSGNPNGRPKKKFSLSQTLEKILYTKDPATKIRRYKLLMNKAFQMALDGNTEMMTYMINRFEGMPKGNMNGAVVNQQVIAILGGQSNKKCPHCGKELY